MKFAAIADIHGNCLALEAVLRDIDQQGIELIVNLGDHFSGPLEAGATAKLLTSHDFPSISGNHDRYLLDTHSDEMGASDIHAYNQLSESDFTWLENLPVTRTLNDEVFLCHGTPANDAHYWMEDITPDGRIVMASYRDIELQAAKIGFPLMLCAHTHLARAVRLGDGRLIVNPGSVGCPGYTDDMPVPHIVETGSPDANYAILEKKTGCWSVSMRQVPYDHMAMSDLAAERGRLDWASALATGWIR